MTLKINDLTGSAADLCKAAMLQVENNLVQHSELRVRWEIFLFYDLFVLPKSVYICDMHTVPKAFYLPIFPCVHRALTVRSLALSTPFTLTVHKVLTVCSQNVHLALTVHSGFT